MIVFILFERSQWSISFIGSSFCFFSDIFCCMLLIVWQMIRMIDWQNNWNDFALHGS